MATTTAARLKQDYNKTIAPDLHKELKLANVHQVPKLEKIVLSVGLGKQKEDKKMFEVAENTLLKITGQKPIITYAKQSIASFKLREGQKIGMKVTLRDRQMYEFLDRLINIVLPRLRDFHGVSSKAFEARATTISALTTSQFSLNLALKKHPTRTECKSRLLLVVKMLNIPELY